MAFILKDSEKVGLTVQFLNAAGNPAVVDGVPVWASSDPGILDVVGSDDGMSAVATAVGPLGQAQVNVTADADLGDGIRSISGVLDIAVAAGEAVSVAITAGTPEPK